MSATFETRAFAYPSKPHLRRHGPSGYVDYKSFKPWLRDEFTFRCAYCLVRERWCHSGAAAFGVDHLLPKSRRPDLICAYDNLLYVCNRCNSAKRLSEVLDPCSKALADHMQISRDGAVVAKTREGQHVIDTFNLNYATATEFRKRKMDILESCHESGRNRIVLDELAFPNDLPRLDVCRCENSRPDGVELSFFEQRIRGELPRTY